MGMLLMRILYTLLLLAVCSISEAQTLKYWYGEDELIILSAEECTPTSWKAILSDISGMSQGCWNLVGEHVVVLIGSKKITYPRSAFEVFVTHNKF
jgi:hypothetical protein